MNDLAITDHSPGRLLELAVEKGADVEQLSKLMDLQERWEARQAKAAFNQALARFQSLCPSMKRSKQIKHGQSVISSYAPLDEIRKTVQPILDECDLLVTFDIQDREDPMQVGCVVSHVLGHSETTYMSGNADESGAKNAIQSRGSALTYLMRYSMTGALGITSADDDDDGNSSGGPIVHRILNHVAKVRELFHSVYQIKQSLADGDLDVAASAWYELSNEEKEMLWLAPTKGGIFTTEELRVMKTTEFREAHYGPTESAGSPATGDAEKAIERA